MNSLSSADQRRDTLEHELAGWQQNRRTAQHEARQQATELHRIIPGSPQERALIRVARRHPRQYLQALAEETAAGQPGVDSKTAT